MKLMLKHKLILLVVLPVLITTCMALSAWWQMQQVTKTATRLTEERLVPVLLLNRISRLYTQQIIDVAHKTRAQMLLWQEAEQQLNEAIEAIAHDWKVYRSSPLTEQEWRLLNSHKKDFANAENTVERLKRYIGERSAYGTGNFIDLELYPGIDPVLGLLQKLAQLQSELAAEAQQRAQATANRARMVLQTTVAILALVVVTIGRWVYWSVITPIRKTRDCVQKIEREQDLRLRTGLPAGDELGELSHALDSMVAKQAGLFQQLQHMGHGLSQAADTLVSVASTTQAKAVRQTDEIDTMVEALERVNLAAERVLNAVEDTTQATRAANVLVDEGNSTVAETIQAISGLANCVTESVGSMLHLQGRSENIGGVLDVIKSIAEQTNLLALNAAIEAARAGDQGRGFAVVADEVRQLASRTSESTEEIQALIESIQQGTRLVADRMLVGQTAVRESVNAAERAELGLRKVVRSFGDIRTYSDTIFQASREQLKVAQAVNARAKTVAGIAVETVGMSRTAADSSQRVAGLAEKLRDLLVSYRT